MIALPPLFVGADQVNVADPLTSIVAIKLRGAPGAVTGVALVDVYAPTPTLVTAATRNWYDVPMDKPLTVKLKPLGDAIVVHVVPSVDCCNK